ncbi:MAG: protein kinase [Gaiellaceae bacterium]
MSPDRDSEAPQGRMTSGPHVGAELAGYRIQELIGRGGMGVVYRAEQVSLGRQVALKLLAPELAADASFRDRFLRESRLAASLDHPNVIPIYDAGEAEGQLYLAMRYVEGEDLESALVREGRLDDERSLSVLEAVARALDAAHTRGLVHRDVKPANVLISGEIVYLTDFGLTKTVADETRLTSTGQFMGSVDYVAPEQIEGKALDGRADVYALACMAYRLLTGRLPYEHEQDVAVIYAHLAEDPPMLSALRSELAAADAVLASALAKSAEQRPVSATAFVAGLASALAPAPARPAEPPAPAAERERKPVTVVAADLDLDELDPEALERLAPRALATAREVLERHGGLLEREDAGSVTAVFGVPHVLEDDALRAVQATVALRDSLVDFSSEVQSVWRVRPEPRFAISSGEVIVGEGKRGATVSGAPVRLAERLVERAGPGEILLARSTHRLVRDRAQVEERDDDAVRLELLTAAEDRSARSDSPLVGRSRELALLEQSFERVAAERACHLFSLLGPAGVGKTRIVDELSRRLEGRARILRGRALPYGDGITFWPIAELVRAAAGIGGDEPPGAATEKLAELLGVEPDAAEVARRIAGLVGLGDHAVTTDEGFWAVRRLLEHLATAEPVVVVLEDVHWAEPTLLDLIEHVADWSRGAPILLLCLARPELLETRTSWAGGKLNATSVLLEPLAAADAEELVRELLGGELAPEVSRHVAAAAEGNPLFVEEMVAMLLDEGLLSREDGRWVAAAGLADASVPPSIQALLAARLDRLQPSHKAIVSRASVEGQVFHRGAVAVLSPPDVRETLGAQLLALVRKELVRPDLASFPGDDAFRFKHILIRDAAYGALPKQLRAELHEALAGWLERAAGERVTEYEEIIGYHLEQAFLYRWELGSDAEDGSRLGELAGGKLAAAGHRAAERGDAPAAVNLLGRARALLPPEIRRVECELDLADALWALGGADAAREVLDAAREGAEAAGADGLAAHAAIQRLSIDVDMDPSIDIDDLRRVVETAFPVFERDGDERGFARAWLAVAEVHTTRCRWESATEALERALGHARRAGGARQLGPVLSYLANALFWGPTPAATGVERCQQLLKEARGHVVAEAFVRSYLAGFEAMLGRYSQARAIIAEARSSLEDIGYTSGLAAQTLLSGSVELLAGEAASAEAEFRRGFDLMEEMGEAGILSSLAALLAEALHAQGQEDEAERFTERGQASAAADDAAAQIAWRAARAKIVARRDPVAAEALAREAVERADETDFLAMQGDALVALADALRAAGREADAKSALQEARTRFVRKGNDAAVRAVDERLAAV